MESYMIQNDGDLNTRHAALLVKMACGFNADITLQHNFQTANAKSILEVMMLGVQSGAVLTVMAQGPDSHRALNALGTLIRTMFKGARMDSESDEISTLLPSSHPALVTVA